MLRPSLALVLTCASLTGCGFTGYATNVRLVPNVVPHAARATRVAIDVSALRSGSTCTAPLNGFATLCVDDLRDTMDDGLEQILHNYAVPVGGAPFDASARFAITSLRLIDRGRGTGILLAWQFVLTDANGSVVELAETTIGPDDFTFGSSDSSPQVEALLEAVLERIGNALNAAHWPPAEVPLASAT